MLLLRSSAQEFYGCQISYWRRNSRVPTLGVEGIVCDKHDRKTKLVHYSTL